MSDTSSFFKVLNKSIDNAERNNKGEPGLLDLYVKVEEKRIESVKTENSSLLEQSVNEGKKSVCEKSEKSSVNERNSEMKDSKEKRIDKQLIENC